MARDKDGHPIMEPMFKVETRGRRSISQRSRDLSERLKSIGGFFDGAPKILELSATAAFFGGLVYFLRPSIRVVSSSNEASVRFKGVLVDRIEFRYPDSWMARNIAILTAAVVAPGSEGLGSLLVPAANAAIFAKFIDAVFPNPAAIAEFGPSPVFPFYTTINRESATDIVHYTQILTDAGVFFPQEGAPFGNVPPGWDATAFVYVKYVLPRWFRAVLVASFFYTLLRFIRKLGT